MKYNGPSENFFNRLFDNPIVELDKIADLTPRIGPEKSLANKYDLLGYECMNDGGVNKTLGNILETRKRQFNALSSHEGLIRQIVIAYPSYNQLQKDQQELFVLDLLLKMPDTEFFILAPFKDPREEGCDPSNMACADMYELLMKVEPVKKRIHFIHIDSSISIWTQDPLVVLCNDDQIKLIEPFYFTGKFYDQNIADRIEEQYPAIISRIRVPLCFQGGNILIGDTFILIGKDSVERSCILRDFLNRKKEFEKNPLDATREGVLKDFRIAFGNTKKVIEIGSGHFVTPPELGVKKIENIDHYIGSGMGVFQALFHLDLFLTLVGKREGISDRFIILVGELCDVATGSHCQIDQSYFKPIRDLLKHTVEQLESIKDEKGNPYFDVRRIIMPVTYATEIDKNKEYRHWRVLSYNNCLVENSNDSPKVWLPTYSEPIYYNQSVGEINFDLLKEADIKAKQTWCELKFKVIPLRNYFPLMVRGGAVHCITKFMHRPSS